MIGKVVPQKNKDVSLPEAWFLLCLSEYDSKFSCIFILHVIDYNVFNIRS